MTIIGTRPELIKMSIVIKELDKHFEHVLVHTGQNYDYELNQVFFENLGVRQPDHFLNAAGNNFANTVASVIAKADAVLDQHKPDALLVYGDTNSCLSAIAAKRQKIPIFHMEAGNRCFDQRVPEELNRKLIDHMSDINLVLSNHARTNLLREGIAPDRIIKTGSHMEEVLATFRTDINNSNVVKRLSLNAKKYFLVSAHREENIDDNNKLNELLKALNLLAVEFNYPVIVSTHPRTRKRIDTGHKITLHENIQFHQAFGFFDYIKLQQDACCTLSDSGTIMEESSLLKFPAITMRDAYERPEGMDGSTMIVSNLDAINILDAVKIIIKQNHTNVDGAKKVPDYHGGAVSQQIVRVVASYTDYINRVVWHKV